MSDKTEKLKWRIAEARNIILKSSNTYRHYKGGIYRVDDIIFDTNIDETAVLYHRIAGPDYNEYAELGIKFSRPLSDFIGMVDVKGKAANYNSIRRFTPVEQIQTTVWRDK